MSLLLEIKDLKKHFPVRSGLFLKETGSVKALDGVSFNLFQGETLGIVGESGCGKSTLGRTILRLYEPTSGRIYFQGQNFCRLKGRALQKVRKEIQMIFQDPYASLNPRLSVAASMGEPLKIHQIGTKKEQEGRITSLLENVGLQKSDAERYPHEFSGGQRQRVCIARALALHPKLLIADEAVSALDVSIQAQILNLMQDLQERFQLTYLFISHNLNVVAHFCDRVLVMYLGKIIEIAPTGKLFKTPLHPYTRALIESIPDVSQRMKKRTLLQGNVPSPETPPKGCHFHPRCIFKKEICEREYPLLQSQDGKEHQVACWLYY